MTSEKRDVTALPLQQSPFDALANYVMVHGGPDRHDLLIALHRAHAVTEAARELLRKPSRAEEWHDAADALSEKLRRLDEWEER